MDILSDKIVTTRKDYICDMCFRKTPKGNKMRAQVNKCDGIQQARICLTCDELMKNHGRYISDDQSWFEGGCVDQCLENGETPEQLLERLNYESRTTRKNRKG